MPVCTRQLQHCAAGTLACASLLAEGLESEVPMPRLPVANEAVLLHKILCCPKDQGYLQQLQPHKHIDCLGLQIKEIMTAAEQAMQSQLAGPTIALLDDMPADLWTRLSNRLSSSTAAAAQVWLPVHNICESVTDCSSRLPACN